jgi:hypothetical protein
MEKRIAVVLCVFLGGCLLVPAARALDLQDGLYEITSKVEIPGMPSSMPPVILKQCLTQKDPVPEQSSAGQECRVKEVKTEGNTVSWTMDCTQQGNRMQGKGSMTFQGDRFTGKSEMIMGPQAGNMLIITRTEGKRIGACDK